MPKLSTALADPSASSRFSDAGRFGSSQRGRRRDGSATAAASPRPSPACGHGPRNRVEKRSRVQFARSALIAVLGRALQIAAAAAAHRSDVRGHHEKCGRPPVNPLGAASQCDTMTTRPSDRP